MLSTISGDMMQSLAATSSANSVVAPVRAQHPADVVAKPAKPISGAVGVALLERKYCPLRHGRLVVVVAVVVVVVVLVVVVVVIVVVVGGCVASWSVIERFAFYDALKKGAKHNTQESKVRLSRSRTTRENVNLPKQEQAEAGRQK